MRVEVWVHAEGQGVVPERSLSELGELLGEHCLGTRALDGGWSAGLAVESDDLTEAVALAGVQVQASAAVAGLPEWPITRADARGPKHRRHRGTSQQVMATGRAQMTSGGDDGSSGDREPRTPLPAPPSLSTSQTSTSQTSTEPPVRQ